MSDYFVHDPLTILAVVCHPADAIDLAGGTLCLHAERGDRVTMVVCTHGVDTHHWRKLDEVHFGDRRESEEEGNDSEVALGVKEREVVAGMDLLGVTDVRFLRFSDELLTVTPELIESIARVMAEVKPHLLITHNPTESLGLADVGHADSAIASLKAIYLAETPRFANFAAPDRQGPAQVFFGTMNGQTTSLTHEGARCPNVLVDITPVVDRKIKAMDCLQSQYYPGDLARKVIEDVNGRVGLHARMPYAEAFQTYYPDGYTHLPANEHLLKLSEKSIGDGLKKMRIMASEVPYEGPPRGNPQQ